MVRAHPPLPRCNPPPALAWLGLPGPFRAIAAHCLWLCQRFLSTRYPSLLSNLTSCLPTYSSISEPSRVTFRLARKTLDPLLHTRTSHRANPEALLTTTGARCCLPSLHLLARPAIGVSPSSPCELFIQTIHIRPQNNSLGSL